MPSVSKNQRALSCLALSMKQGKMDPKRSTQAARMMESMSEDELDKMCHTTDEEMMKAKGG